MRQFRRLARTGPLWVGSKGAIRDSLQSVTYDSSKHHKSLLNGTIRRYFLTAELLQAVEQKFGFVPNVMRQMAESPASLGGMLQLLGLLENSSLSTEEQWLTLLVTSSQNCADYCVAANSTVAEMLGVSREHIQVVRRGQTLADPKLQALRVFATELVQNRGVATPETTQRFLAAGYSHAQLLDVILAIGLETIASFTAIVAETPVDEPFQSNTWSQSTAT